MRKIDRLVYEKWETLIEQESVDGVKQGQQIDCIVLCHVDAPKNRFTVIDSAEGCTEPENSTVFSVAVKSLSILHALNRHLKYGHELDHVVDYRYQNNLVFHILDRNSAFRLDAKKIPECPVHSFRKRELFVEV